MSIHGQFEGLRLLSDPPDLGTWREKLFHVDDTITLTEDEYAILPCLVSCSVLMLPKIPDLLPPRRQCLLAPLYPTPQAQAFRFSLLGLSPQRTSARHQEVN